MKERDIKISVLQGAPWLPPWDPPVGVQGPTLAMALSTGDPSSCTGQVPSCGTCWCPKGGPKGVCSHHHHWSAAQWGHWNQWSCLVILDPKSKLLLKQLLVLLASLWEDEWWLCPAPEPHPHSPRATAKRRIQIGFWKLQFLTPTSPKKQTTKVLCLCSTCPWRTGTPGWVERQSATALRVLGIQASPWSQQRWQPQCPVPTVEVASRVLDSGYQNQEISIPSPSSSSSVFSYTSWIYDHWICTEQERLTQRKFSRIFWSPLQGKMFLLGKEQCAAGLRKLPLHQK